MQVGFAVLALDLVALQRLERLLVCGVPLVHGSDVRAAVALVLLAGRLSVHDHFLVKLMLSIITIALASLTHFFARGMEK